VKVHVDATKCNGYGTCAEHCPSVFQLDDWGYASVIGDGTVAPDDAAAVATAVADCPERAISVEG
jgi:ferredoxin